VSLVLILTKLAQAAKDNFKTSFVPTWFGYFEKLLKSNNGGNGFFVGDKVRCKSRLVS
jgi:hypothetical protein